MARPYQWANKRLTAELRRLKTEIRRLQEPARDRPYAGSDPADVAAEISAADNRRAQLMALEVCRGRVEAALRRLAGNSYGQCEACGGQIDSARLHVMPMATQCCRCQADSERFPRPTWKSQGLH
jgi:DnaK suppressor protein